MEDINGGPWGFHFLLLDIELYPSKFLLNLSIWEGRPTVDEALVKSKGG